MCTTSSTSMRKLSIFVLLLILAFITNTQASCSRWGHACWGGHGKRSGGIAAVPALSSGRGGEGGGGEGRRISGRLSWLDQGNGNLGPLDGSPLFPDSPSSSVDSGSDVSGSRGFPLHSIPSLSSSRTGLGRDKIIMEDSNNNRRDDGEEDMEEVYDYSLQPQTESGRRPNDQDRHDYYDSRGASSLEDTKRPSDLTRKTPTKNNLFLYKLIRIR